MSATDAQIAKAVEIVRAKFTRHWSLDDVFEAIVDKPTFAGIDEPTVYAVAEAALGRLKAQVVKPAPPRPIPVAPPPEPRKPIDYGPARPFRDTPSAPFRFVTIPDVVMPAEPATSHDMPIPGGFCATITVAWAAETPLLIGDVSEAGVVEPLKLPGGHNNYVLPGATLRGLIRNGVEIVAHGRIGVNANLHHRYGLRDFNHPGYAEQSKVERVKAGWLHWDGKADGAWTIQPLGHNWAHVRIQDLVGAKLTGSTRSRADWARTGLFEKYEALGLEYKRAFDFEAPFRFSQSTDRHGRRLATPGGPDSGFLVCAGPSPDPEKKVYEYVFFDRKAGPSVRLAPAVTGLFQRLYSKPSKNKTEPEADGSWALLLPTLEAGRRIPVFYVGDLGRDGQQGAGFAFGLTRLFKVPHDRSVGDVLRQTQPAQLPQSRTEGGIATYDADFVENLFGYVVEPDDAGREKDAPVSPDAVARRGRIAFGFGRLLHRDDVQVSNPVTTVMMAPRASFAPFYLKSDDDTRELDYSAFRAPRLAGRKRYLPRSPAVDARAAWLKIRDAGNRQIRMIEEESGGAPASEEVKSKLRFLMPKNRPDLRFESRIDLHNVTAAELGAILFVLTHGGDPAKPYRHMVGRAKAFGAGQMRVAELRLGVEPNDGTSPLVATPKADEVARDQGRTGFTPVPKPGEDARSNASLRPFLDAFVARMKACEGLGAFPNVKTVREFLGASDPAEGAALERQGRLDYTPLKTFKPLRDAVKPLRKTGKMPPSAPARFDDPDGRILPAPAATRKLFWP